MNKEKGANSHTKTFHNEQCKEETSVTVMGHQQRPIRVDTLKHQNLSGGSDVFRT